MSSEAPAPDALSTLAGHLSARLDADIYLFSGPVEADVVARLMDSHPFAEQRTNCVLILTTYGGSPDAAFMLARFLKRKYAGKLILYIFGACKSAGTLIAIGADEIVMGPHGELGPLDIQLAREDSLWDWNSGLDIFSALGALNTRPSGSSSTSSRSCWRGAGAAFLPGPRQTSPRTWLRSFLRPSPRRSIPCVWAPCSAQSRSHGATERSCNPPVRPLWRS